MVFFFLCFTLSFVLGALLCYFYFFGFPKRQENQAIHNGAASSSTLSDSNLENLESINLPRVTEKLRKIQDLLTDSYLYQENGKDAEEMIYKGFLTSLLQEDPYAAYYTKEEIEETRNRQKGIYKGIGAAVSEKEGGPLVEYVYPGSPAEKAGLLAGDVVLKVDGISVESLSLNYIVENLIQGLPGSSLEMVVNRNGEEVTLRITRGEVVIPGSEVGDVAEMLKLQSGAEKQNETDPQKSEEQQPDVNRDVLAKLKPGDIGYLSLRGFYMEAVDSFISQYESDIDGKKKALIIDLRGIRGVTWKRQPNCWITFCRIICRSRRERTAKTKLYRLKIVAKVLPPPSWKSLPTPIVNLKRTRPCFFIRKISGERGRTGMPRMDMKWDCPSSF